MKFHIAAILSAIFGVVWTLYGHTTIGCIDAGAAVALELVALATEG